MSLAWGSNRPLRREAKLPAPWTAFDYATVGILAAGFIATLLGIANAVWG